uniref:Small ribosomal subunit protein uS7c n=1 Tax=Codium arabicum TaxID=221038 RepID=A0A386B0J9_CODAR|nr:ribosomal protein S7 [Codium arabicum]AYC65226.1 ribosomal protein S7 [Codium arabicum]
MSRRKLKKNTSLLSDPIYQSYLIQLLTNHILKKGKKTLAYKIVQKMLHFIDTKTNKQEDPVDIFNKAINNLRPSFEIKTKRIGGAVYKMPIEINYYRSLTLAVQFLLNATYLKTGKLFYVKLATEILEASQNTGAAIRKKDEIHKIAESNVKLKKKKIN